MADRASTKLLANFESEDMDMEEFNNESDDE